MTSSFKRLRDFIQKQMRMSHIYQPMMIRELLKGSEKAGIRKIAGAFLINAMSCSHGCTHGGRHRSEIGVPATKIVKLIAALLIGFFLSFQHSALAQSAKEASQLNNRAVELFNSGRYSEAEPIFKRALAPSSLLLQRRYNVDGRFVPKCSGFVRPAFMRE